jgi:hypothetical protein
MTATFREILDAMDSLGRLYERTMAELADVEHRGPR